MSEAETIERENIKEIGPLRFDLDRRTVHGPRGRCMLSPLPFAVLERLTRRVGVLIEYNSLISDLWPDPDREPSDPNRNLRNVVTSLRGLLDNLGVTGPSAVEIRTERNVGFMLKVGGRD